MALRLFNGSPAASLPLKAPSAPAALKALVLCALLAGFAHEAAAANMYRYIDDRGNTVFGSTVPPQFVKNGYEVLNERGIVIQTVPRALTPDELAVQEATRAEREAAEALVREQEEADALLMRLYRSPEEIARKRDERITIIDGQLTAMIANVEKLEGEVATTQQTVDTRVAAGGAAPAQVLETLRIQKEELDRTLEQRGRLEADRSTAIADADRDMQRLAGLLGLPTPEIPPPEPPSQEQLPLAEDTETE